MSPWFRFHASDMVLSIDSNTAYHVLSRAESCLTSHLFFCSNAAPSRSVQSVIPICYIMMQLRHHWPLTPPETDNTSANTFIHQQMKHKNLKYRICNTGGSKKIWPNHDSVFCGPDHFAKHFQPSVHQVHTYYSNNNSAILFWCYKWFSVISPITCLQVSINAILSNV